MIKRTASLAIFGALMAALIAGCGKKDDEKGSGDAIGVAECDDYLKKVEACTSKVSPENKAAMESSIKANRDAWKDASKTADGKAALKTGCQAVFEAFITANPSCK